MVPERFQSNFWKLLQTMVLPVTSVKSNQWHQSTAGIWPWATFKGHTNYWSPFISNISNCTAAGSYLTSFWHEVRQKHLSIYNIKNYVDNYMTMPMLARLSSHIFCCYVQVSTMTLKQTNDEQMLWQRNNVSWSTTNHHSAYRPAVLNLFLARGPLPSPSPSHGPPVLR